MVKWILQVDDEALMLLATKRFILKETSQLIQVGSSEGGLEEALRLDREHGADLELMLITDGELSGMRGDELVTKVRELLGPRLKKALVWTGSPAKFHAQAESVGYVVIRKPIDIAVMRDHLRSFLAPDAPP